MILFLVILTSSKIPQEYADLADQAKRNSFLRHNKNIEQEILYPGKHQFDGISFDVLKPFTTTNYKDIKGYAIDQKLNAIAFVSDENFKNNTKKGLALSDEKSSSFYQIEDEIGYDDDVSIYKLRSTDIFSILSNIKITNNLINETKNNLQVKCDNISLYQSSCRIFTGIGYHDFISYDELKNAQLDYFPYTVNVKDSSSENYTFNMKIGGYTSFLASYEINFQSIREFSAKIRFTGEAKFETGFQFPNTNVTFNDFYLSFFDIFKNYSLETIFHNYKFTKFGIDISIDTGLILDILVQNISLDISNDFEISCKAEIEFNKKYTYSTSNGEKIKSKSKAFDYDINYNLTNIDEDTQLSFNFTPTLNIAIFADINFTVHDVNLAQTRIQTGLEKRFETKVNFDNSEKSYCLYPYISYSYTPYMCPYIAISKPVKILIFDIIKPKQYTFRPIWTGETIGPRCLYGVRDPDPKFVIESPVFFADEINDTNSNPMNIKLYFGDQKEVDLNINGDKKLNFVKKVNSTDDELTFKGYWYDPYLINSLLLSFYPNKFQIYSYLYDRKTTITNYFDINAKLSFNFYQGVDMELFEETFPNETAKFAYLNSNTNIALIQHNNNQYVITKTKIYDDLFSFEEDYFYHKKNTWKLEIDTHGININITVLLIHPITKETEAYFNFDESQILTISNQKVALQIVFSNHESKFMMIDFDFNQEKKTIITKELFYDKSIDLIFTPYSPLIFFDLSQFDIGNETGFIPSPVISANEVYSIDQKNQIRTLFDSKAQEYKYIIYHFKTDLKEQLLNETISIVLISQGFYPLNAKEEFPNEIYLIEFDEFTFDDDGYLSFYIPLIRNRDYRNGDEIKIQALFVHPLQNDAYCPNTFHYSQFNSIIPTGCIDNNFDFDTNLELIAVDKKGNQYHPSIIKAEINTFIYVDLFNLKIDDDCIIARVPSFFAEDSLTLNIGEYLANALISYNCNKLNIKCDRCSGIFRDGEIFQANNDQNVEIKLNGESQSDYYAICSSEQDKFCRVKLELNPNKITLIKNPMVTQMTDLNFLENLPPISIPKTQLFSSYGLSAIYYSKDNIAYLKKERELDPGINLEIKAETKGKYVRLYTMTSNNEYFPFAPLSIFSSFEESLKQLGLNSQNLDFYTVRDEIFINDKSALLSLPQNPSSELIYGLSSSLISSIYWNYKLENLVTSDIDSLCLCFADSPNFQCGQFKYLNCYQYLTLTEHEFHNYDAYLPKTVSSRPVAFNIATDVKDYHPDFQNLPVGMSKLCIFTLNGKKFSGSIRVFGGQYIDCYQSIDCTGLDVTVDINIADKSYGEFDASSSISQVTVNCFIFNELQFKVKKYSEYFPRTDTLANVHYLVNYKLNTCGKKVSTIGEYVYGFFNTYNGKYGDETRGHYRFSIVYQENGVHLDEHFCVTDHYGSGCIDDWIPIKTSSLIAVSQNIKSYPDKDNHIVFHLIKNDKNIEQNCLINIANMHQNVHIVMTSPSDYTLNGLLDIYSNLNVSFEDNINMDQLTLNQQVKIGTKSNISLNNKRIKKVDVTVICSDISEKLFDSNQVIIHNFNPDSEYSLLTTSCELEYSTLSFSLTKDSDLILNIAQQFKSLPNKICLYSDSSDKCKAEYGLPIHINEFKSDYIKSGEEVTITVVDDITVSQKLQSKSVIFKGISRYKITGNLELSSDSNAKIENLDISELNLIFTLDVEKDEISIFNLLGCEMLPKTFHCNLLNLNENQITKKFSDLNVKNDISLKWISQEKVFKNIIIKTELITDGNTASVKLNHIVPDHVLCYYNTDSSLCPPDSTPVDKNEMWKSINNSLVYITEDIEIQSINLNDCITYFSGDGKIIGRFQVEGSSVIHFIESKNIIDMELIANVNFSSENSPKIVFGEYNSKLKNWNLTINGIDYTKSVKILENNYLYPNEIISDKNSNIIIEQIGMNTEVHFVQLYEPNSFCVYDYPYETVCLIDYPNYKAIKSRDLSNVNLTSNYEPKFVFASTSTTFLPLQRFKQEDYDLVSIEILHFAIQPIFLIPEDFTVRIIGDASRITTKLALNTSSLQHGNVQFQNNKPKIELIPIDRTTLINNDEMLIINESNCIEISYEIKRSDEAKINDEVNMNEILISSNEKDFDYDSDSIDSLYLNETKDLITLKLTKDTVLNLSLIKCEKLAVYGDENKLSIVNNTIPTLKYLYISSSSINFDSILDFEVGVFNSKINQFPFSTKQQISPELSIEYLNKVDAPDGSFIEIKPKTIQINEEEFTYDERTIELHLNDICSIKDSYGKIVNIYGRKSSVEVEKSQQSTISFNEFEYLNIKSNDDYSNFEFHNISILNFQNSERTQINFYNQKSKNGNLMVHSNPSYIKQMNLHGKQFYSDKTNVGSLSVFDGKSLIEGVDLSDNLQINPGASLIVHSSTINPSNSANFRITSVSPLLVLIDSKFNCSSLNIDLEYSYQLKKYVIIKGFDSNESCKIILDKVVGSKKKKKYDLSCTINKDDETFDLVVENIKNKSTSNKLSKGEIAAIVVPIVCGVILCIILVIVFYSKKNNNTNEQQSERTQDIQNDSNIDI